MKHLLATLILVHECVIVRFRIFKVALVCQLCAPKINKLVKFGQKEFLFYIIKTSYYLFAVFFGKTKHEIYGFLNTKFF